MSRISRCSQNDNNNNSNNSNNSAATIKSELQISVNFQYSCSTFYDFVLKQQKLLDAAAIKSIQYM